MKSFIAAVIIAVILIGGSVGYGIYIDNVTGQIISHTDEIEDLIISGDYAGAKEKLSDFFGLLEKENTILGSITEHKEVFEIKKNIMETDVFLDEKNKEESLSRLQAIKSVSEQMSGNTKLKIRNIL